MSVARIEKSSSVSDIGPSDRAAQRASLDDQKDDQSDGGFGSIVDSEARETQDSGGPGTVTRSVAQKDGAKEPERTGDAVSVENATAAKDALLQAETNELLTLISADTPAAQLSSTTQRPEIPGSAAIQNIQDRVTQDATAIKSDKTTDANSQISISMTGLTARPSAPSGLPQPEEVAALNLRQEMDGNVGVVTNQRRGENKEVIGETQPADVRIVSGRTSSGNQKDPAFDAPPPVISSVVAKDQGNQQASALSSSLHSLVPQDHASLVRRNEETVSTISQGPASNRRSERPATVDVPRPISVSTGGASEIRSVRAQVQAALAPVLRERRNEVSIHLQPPEWGKIDIRVRMDQNEVRLDFRAEHQFVKEALDRGMSQLKSSLLSDGLHLGDVHVGVGGEFSAREERDGERLEEESGTKDSKGKVAASGPQGNVPTTGRRTRADSLVDTVI